MGRREPAIDDPMGHTPSNFAYSDENRQSFQSKPGHHFRSKPATGIASELGADFYFAHPYASWERGANENMNGLIRKSIPKKMPFREITRKDIEFVIHRLNHRPRK